MKILETIQARYDELCAERDRRNKLNEPLQKALDEQNALVEKHQIAARELAAQIEANWGGPAWIDLKKEIGVLAKALSAPRPLPAPPEEAATNAA